MIENNKLNNLKLTEVIVCNVTKGKGTNDDPVRGCYQFWTKDGQFIAEKDINDFLCNSFN